MDATNQKRWIGQWNAAAVALEEDRRESLRELTVAQALAASEALLDLAPTCVLSLQRRTHSGLVEQQAAFARLSTR